MDERIIIPELEKEYVSNKRYVKARDLTYQYSLKFPDIRKLAMESNTYKRIRRQVLIDYPKFDAYIASFYEEGDEKMKRNTDYDDPKLCSEINLKNKKYVRYNEGAYLYSIGKKLFIEMAKKADAVRKVGQVSLVNIEKLNSYIENTND